MSERGSLSTRHSTAEWQLDADSPPVAEAPDRRETGLPSPRFAPARHIEQPPPPVSILEAMLFVSSIPLTVERAAEVIRGLSPAQYQAGIDELSRSYRTQGRPYVIHKEDQGHVLSLRPTFRFVLEKLYGSGREARLGQPAVEVLAIVAYRQPVTREEVETIRGHSSGAHLRQLLRRGLIGVVGRGATGDADVRYGTTPRFLELFGLTSLDDLPETEDTARL
jgi:segregation and condensation protein B